jgi:hypothetical protein
MSLLYTLLSVYRVERILIQVVRSMETIITKQIVASLKIISKVRERGGGDLNAILSI